MLYGLFVTLFAIISFLLILIILIQQGKSSMGMGNFGGSAQMLFGGSGGQDIFQKITWVLAALFMLGSFGLAVYRDSSSGSSRYLNRAPVQQAAPIKPQAAAPQETPVTETEPVEAAAE
jgi:preprotein translocase subunit SecG